MYTVSLVDDCGYDFSDVFTEDDAQAIKTCNLAEKFALSRNRAAFLLIGGWFAITHFKGTDFDQARITTMRYRDIVSQLGTLAVAS
ncbi:hypothetical protein [Noviherbaspirillum pedocola]|uniref:Uncharacterized protein n=1 Tax=Noviherbaspirillum pedocola TaxID=2801341 RepID=A0A934SVB6_9BURK|nr:hypothetical protein [Noviherbaspirillum pedocola]MBK4737250.1 hypothetical protein [Noviherbaspirillum pedocola]